MTVPISCPTCGTARTCARCAFMDMQDADLAAELRAGGPGPTLGHLAAPDDGRDDGITDLYGEEMWI